ncbi:MAG: methyl-accepting chemotaxis protein [Pseudomonadota bacterium]
MQAFKRLSVTSKFMVVGGGAAGILLLAASTLVFLFTSRITATLSDRYIEAVAQSASEHSAGVINTVQARVVIMANAITSLYEAGTRDRATILKVITPNALSSESVMASWFLAAPNALDGQDAAMKGRGDLGSGANGVFIPYVVHTGDRTRLDLLDSEDVITASYTAESARTRQSAIVEPYLYMVAGKNVAMISITVPVVVNNKLIGVAGMDMALSDLTADLGALRPFGDGRVMLLSSGLSWAAHSDAALQTKPYDGVGKAAVAQALRDGTEVQIDGIADADGALDRFVFPVRLPVLSTTWAVVLDAPKATIEAPARRLAFGLAVGGLVILIAVLAALLVAARSVVRRPLARLVKAVEMLGSGHYDIEVEGCDTGDEVGAVARALDGFRHDLAETQRLRTSQESQRAQSEAERQTNEAVRSEAAKVQAHIVNDLAVGLEHLAKGDLTFRLSEPFGADYEVLRSDFNNALEQLQNAMTVIARATDGMHSGAMQISQASGDLSRRTEQQAASLEETAAALDQATASVSKAATNSAAASNAVRAAKMDAEQSGVVMHDAIAAMSEIEKSSQQIGQIIGVIDEIAFQTNLLALNAGVEAARAGEAGRGFAVVASEVRALAQRAGEAAKEIKTLISSSTQQVQSGAQLIDSAGSALERIVAQVSGLDLTMRDMATAAGEQAVGLGEINTAVNQMDQMTQQNAAMVEEATATSQSLLQDANELSRLVGHFRLGAGIAPVEAVEATPAAPARRTKAALTIAHSRAATARNL